MNELTGGSGSECIRYWIGEALRRRKVSALGGPGFTRQLGALLGIGGGSIVLQWTRRDDQERLA